MLCALIMAGGKGERFWPLSTDEKPKQFLQLLGEDTMIQMTIKRLDGLIPIERIFVVTAEKYVQLVKKQIPMLPENNIIIEPVGKNTAPCIALSAFYINKYYKDATIAVLPADHLIINDNKFRNTIDTAYKFIQDNEEAVVTIGMEPDRPETGYGYIKYKEDSVAINDFVIKEVESFVEKPCLEKAKEYIIDGHYLWNAGMFVWKTSNILRLIERHLPSIYSILKNVFDAPENEFYKKLSEEYVKIEGVSIDYGIMEKAENIFVIPSQFGWDDVGTWHAVARYREPDIHNNIYIGDIKSIDCTDNIVISNKKPIVVTGIKDLFIVENDDMIFISTVDNIDKIKEIKQEIS